jgi:hypothetical protein
MRRSDSLQVLEYCFDFFESNFYVYIMSLLLSNKYNIITEESSRTGTALLLSSFGFCFVRPRTS